MIKCLSILQPWAFLIVRPDLGTPEAREEARAAGHIKDIENRCWRTSFRGRILIHAGKKWGREQRDDLARVREMFPGIDIPDQYDLGGIIGAATISDCVDQSSSRWFFGPHGFVMKESKPCQFIPWKGALGLFAVPNSAIAHLYDKAESHA